MLCAYPISGWSADGVDRGIGDFPKLSAERDWPWWRGPSRNGIAAAPTAPVKFSDSDNVLWKAPVPGRGHSSPIVVGNQVILSTATKSPQVQSVLAFDRKTGRELWKTYISEGGFPEQNHPKNTEATPTVACDGERLFVTFFHHKTVQCTALDLSGKKIWQETVGPFNPQSFRYGRSIADSVSRVGHRLGGIRRRECDHRARPAIGQPTLAHQAAEHDHVLNAGGRARCGERSVAHQRSRASRKLRSE